MPKHFIRYFICFQEIQGRAYNTVRAKLFISKQSVARWYEKSPQPCLAGSPCKAQLCGVLPQMAPPPFRHLITASSELVLVQRVTWLHSFVRVDRLDVVLLC